MKYDPFCIYGWYCYDPDRLIKDIDINPYTTIVRHMLQTNAK